MVKIVDDDIQEIKKELAKMKHEIERLKAVTECQNLMNRYQYYHMRRMRTEETMLFALKTPGGAVEMFWGIYDEPEGILRWKRYEGFGKPRSNGNFNMHGMTTPIIEVAKDGQTARGLWLMVGAETTVKDGKAQANWGAAQFAMDFIKEDGEWKIWKYNTTGLIYSPFEKGWHKENPIPERLLKDDAIPAEFKADRPPAYPYLWNPDHYIENIPPVPLPYETWDDSLSCVPPPGKKWDLPKKKK